MATSAITNPCYDHRSPTLVLVAGAFHLGSALDRFAEELRALGNRVETLGLTTVDNAAASIPDDTRVLVQQRLVPLIQERGEDVILYLHSYAGFPGSVAIAGLSKQQRHKDGQKGGVVGLIYQSAFIPLTNQTLVQAIGGSYASWQSTTPDSLIKVLHPAATFYNDISESQAEIAVASFVRQQSMLSFNTPSREPHYGDSAYDGKRHYLRTQQDHALPPSAQDALIAKSLVLWQITNLNTSHSPWLSKPAALAKQVNRIKEDIMRQT